jgi:glycosyltransferase involved in cell wall biosynthesis
VRVLIAIPVYNERQYVAGVLAKVARFHRDTLVIDDGSTDGTAQVLDELAAKGAIHVIRHPENRGYGQSLIDAFAFAAGHGYDWVITMDCDEQHEPEMIPQFISHIRMNDADIISGTRYLHPVQGDDAPPKDRQRINRTLTAILNELFSLRITDAFCGFKAHRVSAMRRLRLDEPGYAFPMQLWPQAAAAGLIIKEIPVRRIYKDQNRFFGGTLDDPENRFRHYVDVLQAEIDRLRQPAPAAAHAIDCCCCQC